MVILLTYDNDINAEQHQLAAQGVRHALQGMLGGAVGSHKGRAVLARDGGHVDDAPGALRRECYGSQQRQERLRTRHGRLLSIIMQNALLHRDGGQFDDAPGALCRRRCGSQQRQVCLRTRHSRLFSMQFRVLYKREIEGASMTHSRCRLQVATAQSRYRNACC